MLSKFFLVKKKVSSSPYEHMLGKPDVKYVGGIHGNEAVGRELLLHLIQYFVTNYQTDSYVKWLLDNTRIHILPSLNVSEFVIGNSFIYKSLESIIRGWFINFSTLRGTRADILGIYDKNLLSSFWVKSFKCVSKNFLLSTFVNFEIF